MYPHIKYVTQFYVMIKLNNEFAWTNTVTLHTKKATTTTKQKNEPKTQGNSMKVVTF